MNTTSLQGLVAGAGLITILAACSADDGATASLVATAVPTASASEAASPSPSPSPSASSSTAATEAPSFASTAEPTAAEASPEPTAAGFPSEFAVAPNADADALFAVRDRCRNPQDGYEVELPDDWYTNTEIRDVPACSWFSPTFYTVDDFDAVPDEIAIEIFWIAGERHASRDVTDSEDGLVGGQNATRSELAGTSTDPAEGTSYEYVIQLGPTPEAGPNLVARTDTAMGGDYELNKAVLDRIVATMEFRGSVQ